MSKKLKFPLLLKDNAQVRTLEELRNNFDLERVLGYYQSGKLQTWLEDHEYEAEAAKIQTLDEHNPAFLQMLCNVLGVAILDNTIVDLDALAEKQERREQLRQYTSDPVLLEQIDSVAFDQEDLAELLDEQKKTIYLCEGRYYIPMSRTGIHYIGIGNASITNFKRFLEANTAHLNILFENCYFESADGKMVPCTETAYLANQRL